MRTFIFILALGFLLNSCSKQKRNKQAFYGVWVETTLRLDTLDFEFGNRVDWSGDYSALQFSTNTYTDTVLNPYYPVNHSDTYEYFFNNTMSQINMRGSVSSSTNFGVLSFALSGNKQRFSISKFYFRRSLPAVIEFVRIR